MSEIIVTRIDDRLIHGQVMTGWVKVHQITNIVICDNELRNDDFMKSVLEMAIPSHMKLDVFDIEEAVEKLATVDSDGADNRILILTKGPQPLFELIKNNIGIKEIVVGGMGINSNRRKVFRNIAASDSEISYFHEIAKLNIPVVFKLLPNDNPIEFIEQIKLADQEPAFN